MAFCGFWSIGKVKTSKRISRYSVNSVGNQREGVSRAFITSAGTKKGNYRGITAWQSVSFVISVNRNKAKICGIKMRKIRENLREQKKGNYL
jgi:hypothetical protein